MFKCRRSNVSAPNIWDFSTITECYFSIYYADTMVEVQPAGEQYPAHHNIALYPDFRSRKFLKRLTAMNE